MISLRRRPKTQATMAREIHLPAPIGGVNTVNSGTDMPPADSIYSYNMIGAEYGLRSRLGWREWCTTLGGDVRSLLPFTGSTKDGANNRLFACTQAGIWDVSSSSAAPTQVVTFGTQNSDSGWGQSTVFVNAGGHFLVYTDEANGLYLYTESTSTWTKIAQASQTAWAPNTTYAINAYVTNQGLTYKASAGGTSAGTPWAPGTAYAVGDICSSNGQLYRCAVAGTSQGGAWQSGTAYVIGQIVTNGGNSYLCTKAGTSAGSGGPTGTTGSAIVDNTAEWQYLAEAAPGPSGAETFRDGTVTWEWFAGGPSGTTNSITDGGVTWAYVPSIANVDPALFVGCLAWKNRLWFIERDTGNAWYLPVNCLTGSASKFAFGARFKYGGDLRCLASWTYDGGSGIDDALVAVSGGGDVVIYKGTDPATPGMFSLQGVWYVGAVPAGRRLTTDFGGDVLVMSSVGIMPLSKLVIGNVVYDRSQYSTYKISNLFNQLQAQTSSLRGWSMRLHPADAALMVLVPTQANQSQQQLVMSLATRGWHTYRDLPMGVCAEPWNGSLYFGTADGRVCINDGYVDGVLLSDPNAYTPIQCSGLTAFSNLGSPSQKRIQSIRLRLTSQGGSVPMKAEPRFGFDFTEIPTVTATAPATGATWDSAVWDTSGWAGAYQPQSQVFGAFGCGVELAVAFRFASSSRTTLIGMDVSLDAGGWL